MLKLLFVFVRAGQHLTNHDSHSFLECISFDWFHSVLKLLLVSFHVEQHLTNHDRATAFCINYRYQASPRELQAEQNPLPPSTAAVSLSESREQRYIKAINNTVHTTDVLHHCCKSGFTETLKLYPDLLHENNNKPPTRRPQAHHSTTKIHKWRLNKSHIRSWAEWQTNKQTPRSVGKLSSVSNEMKSMMKTPNGTVNTTKKQFCTFTARSYGLHPFNSGQWSGTKGWVGGELGGGGGGLRAGWRMEKEKGAVIQWAEHYASTAWQPKKCKTLLTRRHTYLQQKSQYQ